MAIAHIGVNDEQSIAKINEAIDKANLVDGKLDNSSAAGRILGRSSTGTGAVQQLTASGGLEVASGTVRIEDGGVTTAKMANGAASNAKLANMATQTLKGRTSAGSGPPQDLTVAQAKSMLGVTALEQGMSDEADARTSEDARRPIYGQVQPPIRPGEAIQYFTSALDGEPATLLPLPENNSVASEFGKVAQVAGAGVVAPLAAWRIEPGHLYRVRFVVRRAVDTEDPANDAVRLGIRWLSAAKDGVGTAQLANLLDLTVEDGRVEYVFTLATADASDVDAVPAAGGIYFRPFVRAFGSGVTHVEVIQVVDATDAVVWSPDVELLQREIASLNVQIQTLSDRVQTLES